MSQKPKQTFQVTPWVHRLGGSIERRQGLWVKLGSVETRFLTDRLARTHVVEPIYICGLARSGTTILLEIIARHPDVATHQYRDYPPIYTPFWWNWMLRYMERDKRKPVERSHGDGIFVTPASPEAMEEIIWMTFFPEAHRPEVSNVLDADTSNAEFESFYQDHIKKLLLARGGHRYASKGNYNVTRLEYIQQILPDARFVIPIREPVAHIASLMRQHRLFCEGTRDNPKASEHLQRVGHFEFGPDRRPINSGDSERVRQIVDLWSRGEEVRGWARYWAQIYTYVADQLDRNEKLRLASIIVRFEDLCDRPDESLRNIFDHIRFDNSKGLIEEYSKKLRSPTYYRQEFTDEELEVIAEETGLTASRFGYTGA